MSNPVNTEASDGLIILNLTKGEITVFDEWLMEKEYLDSVSIMVFPKDENHMLVITGDYSHRWRNQINPEIRNYFKDKEVIHSVVSS